MCVQVYIVHFINLLCLICYRTCYIADTTLISQWNGVVTLVREAHESSCLRDFLVGGEFVICWVVLLYK